MDPGAISLDVLGAMRSGLGIKAPRRRPDLKAKTHSPSRTHTLLLSETDRQGNDTRAASIFRSVGRCSGWSFPDVVNLTARGRLQVEPALRRHSMLEQTVDAIRSPCSRTDGKIFVEPGIA
jgi:hypothetical protein